MSEEEMFEIWFQHHRRETFKRGAFAGETIEDHPHWSMGLRPHYLEGWLARSSLQVVPKCHVCRHPTKTACSDCRLNFGAIVYVCANTACRDYHESKCFGDGSGWKSDLERWEAYKKASTNTKQGD